MSARIGLLVLLLAPGAAQADVCDFFGQAVSGARSAQVSLLIDVAARELDYTIATNGLGTIEDARITRGGQELVDLQPVGVGGIATDLLITPATSYTDFVANPEDYTVEVVGSTASLDVTVSLVGECEEVAPGPVVDLAVTKIKVTRNKLKATVRNTSGPASARAVVRFFLSIDTVPSNDDLVLEGKLKKIKPGKKKTAKVSKSSVPTGSFFIIAEADPSRLNDDPDRTNNVFLKATAVDFD